MAIAQEKIDHGPWLSLGLFCLAYGIFGWLIGVSIGNWQAWLLHHSVAGWHLRDPAIALRLAWGLGASLVLLLMVLLMAPLRIMRLLFGSWLRSDAKAFMSVLGWAFAAVLVICWLPQFVRFFVLLSAGILCHFDLQIHGYRAWQVFLILSGISLGSFACGGYLFFRFGEALLVSS